MLPLNLEGLISEDELVRLLSHELKVLDYTELYAVCAIESLLYQFLNKLCEIDEIRYENIFIDGTKIEAAANRYTIDPEPKP